MDKKEYFTFLDELNKRFLPFKFYFLSETALKVYRKNIPDTFYILSDIDLISLYSNFDNVIHLKFSTYDYFINFNNFKIFIKHFESIKKNTKDFLLCFNNYNKDPFVINIFYDPLKEIMFDFNSILHNINNNSIIIENNSFKAILKTLILKNNLQIKTILIKDKTDLYEFDFNFFLKVSKSVLNEIDKYITLSEFFNIFHTSITGIGKYNNLIFLDKIKLFDVFLPELAKLKFVNQNKDHHPEGNAFDHSLLTVKNIESSDFALNLAALFHDIGKYKTEIKNPSFNESKFPYHSRTGALITMKILKRWEKFLIIFPDIFLQVQFLIENHMNIGFLDKLDFNKQIEILNSPYLPGLLKLFKADAKSSFKNLNRYKRIISFIKSNKKYIKN